MQATYEGGQWNITMDFYGTTLTAMGPTMEVALANLVWWIEQHIADERTGGPPYRARALGADA